MVTAINSQPSPIEHLKALMGRRDSCLVPTMKKVMEIAEKTIGISEENYLAWQREFLGPTGYIDGISADLLGDKHLVWGYDPQGRLFITFQYQIVTTDKEGNKTTERESSTLFQRYKNEFGTVAQAGNKKYRLDLNSSYQDHLLGLDILLSGDPVVRFDEEEECFRTAKYEYSLTNKESRALPTTDRWLRIKGSTEEETEKLAQPHTDHAAPLIVSCQPEELKREE